MLDNEKIMESWNISRKKTSFRAWNPRRSSHTIVDNASASVIKLSMDRIIHPLLSYQVVFNLEAPLTCSTPNAKDQLITAMHGSQFAHILGKCRPSHGIHWSAELPQNQCLRLMNGWPSEWFAPNYCNSFHLHFHWSKMNHWFCCNCGICQDSSVFLTRFTSKLLWNHKVKRV